MVIAECHFAAVLWALGSSFILMKIGNGEKRREEIKVAFCELN